MNDVVQMATLASDVALPDEPQEVPAETPTPMHRARRALAQLSALLDTSEALRWQVEAGMATWPQGRRERAATVLAELDRHVSDLADVLDVA